MTPLAPVNGAKECQAWRPSATFPQLSANFTHAACRYWASPQSRVAAYGRAKLTTFGNQRSDTSKLF
jgi:hypothetical protein